MTNQSTLTLPTAIERETGLSRDLLRKWRSRYHFPIPLRQDNGTQGYSREQINQLRLIKRLLDAGFRPALIVGKPLAELERLLAAVTDPRETAVAGPTTLAVIACLKANDLDGLTAILTDELTRQGLSEFTRQTAAPLAEGLGKAWANGSIEVFQEHICTEVMSRLLITRMSFAKAKPHYPTILFGTPPAEQHILGMLMAQAVLADHGARCISIGAHAPIGELALAAQACRADIVAISFSFSYPSQHIRPLLMHLRSLLPVSTEIWAGGAGLSHIKRAPPGIQVFTDLDGPVLALRKWTSIEDPAYV